jgi:hypothetical protein
MLAGEREHGDGEATDNNDISPPDREHCGVFGEASVFC